MTTTELIKLLKGIEFGASGRAREISFRVPSKAKTFIYEPKIVIDGTGDGICGAEVSLKIIIKKK